ncbi:TrmH family RNA methyltransferase [Rubrivirga sp.]|uniref:TrmH family RNA methyltransferase n=1 Tax=Rubrivirga sp. TaxID=1885344 RepID=UPI003C7114D2
MPPHPVVVVANDIRSAHNVGSIFRTADSAGLEGVVLTGFTPTPDHAGVGKSALGAQDAVPWSQAGTVLEAVASLRERGFTIAALERTPGALEIDAIEADAFPLALVLGNEVWGVPDDVLEDADLVIGLPQYGVKASLNVSVAFGVAAYGLVRVVRSA